MLGRESKRKGIRSVNEPGDVDCDQQFIPEEKDDAKMSYKKAKGYFPGGASVGGCSVYIENRDGNTNVRFCQADTLKRTIKR